MHARVENRFMWIVYCLRFLHFSQNVIEALIWPIWEIPSSISEFTLSIIEEWWAGKITIEIVCEFQLKHIGPSRNFIVMCKMKSIHRGKCPLSLCPSCKNPWLFTATQRWILKKIAFSTKCLRLEHFALQTKRLHQYRTNKMHIHSTRIFVLFIQHLFSTEEALFLGCKEKQKLSFCWVLLVFYISIFAFLFHKSITIRGGNVSGQSWILHFLESWKSVLNDWWKCKQTSPECSKT